MKSELPPTMATAPKKETPSESALSLFLTTKIPYKFWALAAILLLALCSMFAGSLSLKSSSAAAAAAFARLHDGPRHHPIFHDLDILEVEERERTVRHLWNLYTHGGAARRLPRFWSEAFEAAYEDLIGDVAAVRDAAFLEIARMSLQSVHVDPISIEYKGGSRLRSSKQAQLAD